MADSKRLVSIEWKGYCSALLCGVWKIFNDQLFVDVSVTCHQQGLKVHRWILAVFFQGIKDSLANTSGEYGLAADAGHGVKELCLDHLSKDNQGADVLRYLIEFAYSGKVALPENRLSNVLDAAEVVGFKGLAQSIRDKLGKRVFDVAADEKTSSGLLDSCASNGANCGPAAFADDAVAVGSTRPKRSNRKGIPKKLIKTPRRLAKNDIAVVAKAADVAVVSGQASMKCKGAPAETARTIRLRLRNRNVPKVSSDDDDTAELGGGTDPMPSASNSKESSDEPFNVDQGDCAEVEPKARGRKLQRFVASKQNASMGPKGKKRRCSAARKTASVTESKPRPKRIRIRIRTTLRCDRCEYTSTSKPRFDAHCAKHDQPVVEKVYPCKLCPKVFRSNHGHRDHMVSHNPELQHKCKLCSFITNQKWSFRHHLAVMHFVDEAGNPVAKRFGCPECAYQCVTNRQLRAHVLLKHPTNFHKCDFCDYMHPRPHRVKNHMAAVHNIDNNTGKSVGREVKCQECDYSCFTKSQMSDHVLRRHKPDKLKMCDECGYTTAYTAELQRHVKLVHRGEYNYMCDSCGMRIKTFSGLARHKRTHLGLKPFKCALCPKAFAEKHNLKAHMDRHERRKNQEIAARNNSDSIKDEISVPLGHQDECASAAVASAHGAHMLIDRTSSDSSTGHQHNNQQQLPAVKEYEDQRAPVEGMAGPPASVVRFLGQGGSVECFGGLRLAVDRFDGLVECGGLFQDL